MNNIKELKLRKKHELKKAERSVKFWNFIYRLVGYMHICFAGPAAVNAFKELISLQSIQGTVILAGSFVSFFISATILEKIVSNKKEKKTKLLLDLKILEEEEQKEKLRKRQSKTNNINRTNQIRKNNDFILEDKQEIKLSLKRK